MPRRAVESEHDGRPLACHAGVAAQLADPASLHGALETRPQSLECQGSNAEHRGPAGNPTNRDEKSFPHEAAGYSLQAHRKTAQGAALRCQDCYPSAGSSRFDTATCDARHRLIGVHFVQVHEQAYGAPCLCCHDSVDTYGKRFDHAKQAFALVGKHAAMPCAGCHAGAMTPADLKVTLQQCVASHQRDAPHQGKFGRDYGSCDTQVDWKQSTFHHSKSAFLLTGAHLPVGCVKCHVNGVFKGRRPNAWPATQSLTCTRGCWA